jgi:hypothetical protein
VLTPKFGKSRLGPRRPVRPGPRGGLTGCPVAGLALYKYKGSWPIETYDPIVIINFTLFLSKP